MNIKSGRLVLSGVLVFFVASESSFADVLNVDSSTPTTPDGWYSPLNSSSNNDVYVVSFNTSKTVAGGAGDQSLNNNVYLEGSALGVVYGGYSKVLSENNLVRMVGGSALMVFGGGTGDIGRSGVAKYNSVEIVGGSSDSVQGSNATTAIYGSVFLENFTSSGLGYVIGGKGSFVSDNHILIVDSNVGRVQASELVSPKSGSYAINNTVELRGETSVKDWVYGSIYTGGVCGY